VVVAVGTWDLHLPGCHSLKEKRGMVRPLIRRLGDRLNVSVAETGHHDRWQRAEIACAAVAADRGLAESAMRAADRMIEDTDGVRVIDSATWYR